MTLTVGANAAIKTHLLLSQKAPCGRLNQKIGDHAWGYEGCNLIKVGAQFGGRLAEAALYVPSDIFVGSGKKTDDGIGDEGLVTSAAVVLAAVAAGSASALGGTLGAGKAILKSPLYLLGNKNLLGKVKKHASIGSHLLGVPTGILAGGATGAAANVLRIPSTTIRAGAVLSMGSLGIVPEIIRRGCGKILCLFTK